MTIDIRTLMHENVDRFFNSLTEKELSDLETQVVDKLESERLKPTRYESVKSILELIPDKVIPQELASFHLIEERESDALRICRDVLY